MASTSTLAWGRALRRTAFRKVWGVTASFQVGYWFYAISLQWLVAKQTDNDAAILGVLYFVMLSPMLLGSVHTGVILDRFDVRTTFIWTQVIVVVLAAVTVLGISTGHASTGFLIACSFVMGVGVTVANPAAATLGAFSVTSEELASAVPLQGLAMNAARTVAPAACGLVIAWVGPIPAVALSGVGNAVALILLLLLRLPERRVTIATGPRSIRAGIAHARSRPPTLLLIGFVGMLIIFGVSYLAQLPVIATLSSGSSEAFITLTTLGGLGSFCGVLWLTLRSSRIPHLHVAFVSCIVLGAAVMTLGLGRVMAVAFIAVFIAGASQFIAITIAQHAVQVAVDDEFRGRVMSLFSLAWGGMMPVGGLTLGLLIALVGTTAGTVASGLITVGVGIAARMLVRRAAIRW